MSLAAHLRLPEFRVSDVHIREAAAALSRIYRYAGNSRYSVGQHSLVVCDLVVYQGCTREEEQWSLVHDLPEYLYGDVLYWLKKALGDQLRTVTDPLDRVVLEAVGMADVSPEVQRRVKIADNAAAHLEAYHEFGMKSSGDIGLSLAQDSGYEIPEPMEPALVQALYLQSFVKLFGRDVFERLGG